MHHVSQRVLSQITWVAPPVHLCTGENYHERSENSCIICGRKWNYSGFMFPPYRVNFLNRSKKWAIKARKLIVIKELNDNYDYGSLDEEPIEVKSNISRFDEGPVIEKYKTQIGVIHPIPTIQISRSSSGLFVLFFLMGMLCDKLLTSKKRYNWSGIWPRVPTSVSLLLEKDLQRKESVEWVNMVLGKLWKVYRKGIENWIIGLLQPVIDNLEKPEYVQRVQIKQFSLGEEPLSVRNVERLTSRRANDLQYQIGLRYTGDARALLSLSLKFALLPIVVPVGIRDFDIDGELWVKLRLIESEPWVGGASWAFVSLPKIKFELSPFRLFNLMAIPVLSMFLTKLLTEDLPRLFVRPKKIVLDFQSGRTVGTPNGFRSVSIEEGNKDFVGELSVTLVDAQKLPYLFSGKTDPYVVLSVGDQVIRSKRNSQTTVIGPPGGPIWNQDFHMLVANPQKQKLVIHVKDSIGFADFTIGGGEVDLGSLKDTVPTDRVIILEGGWGFPRKRYSGQVSVRLTYKAYVEDEEDDWKKMESLDCDVSDDENLDFNESENNQRPSYKTEKESLINIIQELLVSEEFKDILASEIRKTDFLESSKGLGQTLSSSRGRNKIFAALSSGNGSALVWLALMSSIATFISMKMGGTSFFSL